MSKRGPGGSESDNGVHRTAIDAELFTGADRTPAVRVYLGGGEFVTARATTAHAVFYTALYLNL